MKITRADQANVKTISNYLDRVPADVAGSIAYGWDLSVPLARLITLGMVTGISADASHDLETLASNIIRARTAEHWTATTANQDDVAAIDRDQLAEVIAELDLQDAIIVKTLSFQELASVIIGKLS